MRTQPNRSVTYRLKAEARLVSWPGGADGAVADYISGKASIADIGRATGVAYRAMCRILVARGAPIRSVGEANKLQYAAHPERKERVAEANRLNPPSNQPEVRARMIATRKATHLIDPSAHPNFHVKMSIHERAFADALDAVGVVWQFNFPCPPFWLDFLIHDLSIGVELQRENGYADQARDLALRHGIGLRAILYFSAYQMRLGRVDDLVQVVLDIQSGSLDPSALGEYTMISRQPHGKAFLQLNGHKFRRPFGRMSANHRTPAATMRPDEILPDDFLDRDEAAMSEN